MTNQLQLDVTSSAQDFIRNQMRGQQAQFIRLGIEESGCNGFMYTLDFTQSPEDEDLCIEVSNDLSIFVSPNKAELVHGTCIDLEVEGLNSNIVFKNPNAFSYCGYVTVITCGTKVRRFAVERFRNAVHVIL